METQRAVVVQRRNVAIPKIRLYECPYHRLRHGEEPLCRLWRAALRGNSQTFRPRLRFDARQAQKSAGFVGDIVKLDESAALADDVQKIAMLAGGGVGLMFS
jgi:hypothetical protein